ncbi:MAG TPA: HAD family hydrolase [bacterium]
MTVPKPAVLGRPLLVLDFDGVICDSIHDSFRTALNTYIRFRKGHALPLRKPLDTAEATFRFEREHPEVFERFRAILPLGNRAEDYCVMLTILYRGEAGSITGQDDFDAYGKTISPQEQREYHRLFYEDRNRLQKADPKDWSGLLPIFPGMAGALHRLSRRFVLCIATSKDRASVDLQMKAYGIEPLFLPENILDKDFAESKRDHLVRLHERHGVPFSSIHFIDDKVLHLVSVKDLGAKCYLATWGFNTPREHKIAEREGFVLLTMDGLKELGGKMEPGSGG